MPRNRFYATAALGLCLGALPLAGFAQSTAPVADVPAAVTPDAGGPIGDGSVADGVEATDQPHFVPIVSACVEAPNEDDCGQVRALIPECAQDLDYALCDVLFENSEEIFEDPQMLERAQEILSQTSESIAEMQFTEADGEIGGAIEATRAMSERTLLRGAENLNSHSSPPLATDE